MRLAAALFILPLLFTATPSSASFWKTGDWQNRKHHLTVCLDATGCPASMADSVKAAIKLWNAESLSWRFSYSDDCGGADIKISCKDIAGRGKTQWHTKSKNNTNAKVIIDSNSDWGWCDDKFEIVSTIAHELGHCCRLKDESKEEQWVCMRSLQRRADHYRGPSYEDVVEAAASDTSGAKASAPTSPDDTTPEHVYYGTITPGAGTEPLRLNDATSVDLRPLHPDLLEILCFEPMSDESLGWIAVAHPPAPQMLVYHLEIDYPESTTVREGILYVTGQEWQPDWQPHAIARPDTTVASDTSRVILDARDSWHPAGDVMAFAWTIDDTIGIQGGEYTSVTLSPGLHLCELTAIDHAGRVDYDTMMVNVEESTGIEDRDRRIDRLRLSFPVPSRISGTLPISFALDAHGPVRLRILDVTGRELRVLVDGEPFAAGVHRIGWDFTDASGREVSAGIYFCSLRQGTAAETRKVILVR